MVSAPARLLIRVIVLSLIAAVPATAKAQLNGVLVDPTGVLRSFSVKDVTDAVRRQQTAAALAKLDQEIASRSEMRKVSLIRLERAGVPPSHLMATPIRWKVPSDNCTKKHIKPS